MGLGRHLRNTFLAGIFAAVPVVATVAVVAWVEGITRRVWVALTGWDIPFLGIVAAVAVIYLLGLLVTSLIGKWLLSLVDRLLGRIPMLRDLYAAWKQISVTPGGGEGIFGKVCLITDTFSGARTIGFTSGEPMPEDPATCCVFVPAAPNPTNGRLYFVGRDRVEMLGITPEEAFKMILSGGNYIPPGMAAPPPNPSPAAVTLGD